MGIELLDFQQNAVEEMLNYSDLLLKSKEQDKYILLEAITGAGKTIMALDYIEKAFNKFNDICFIWLTIGSGGLHNQSYNRLRNTLPTYVNVKVAESSITYDKLNHKDVLVVNWEKVNRKDSETLKLMRSGENRNLPDLIKATKNNGTKIILIIDESHDTADSDLSKEIINMIDPVFKIEMSATPNIRPGKPEELKHKAFHVYINPQLVIGSKLIKKNILINEFINKDKKGVNKLFVNAGIDKRNQIENEIKYLNNNGENIKFNPLALIQLPNGKTDTKDDIIQILKERDITIENGKLAIWLTGELPNKEGIEQLDSKVEVLIFKQAIATGWDCPRACVLIRLREVKSISFDLQTVGRILRMPERRHYNNSLLDNAFIFVDTEDYKVDIEAYNHILNKALCVRKEFIDDFRNLSFETYTKIRNNLNISIGRIVDELKSDLKDRYLLNNNDIIRNYNEGSLKTEDIINKDAHMDIKHSNSVSLSDKEIGRRFDNFFEKIDIRNKERIQEGFIQYFIEEYNLSEDEDDDLMTVQKSLLNNEAIVENSLRSIKRRLIDEKETDYVAIKDELLNFDIEVLIKEKEENLILDYNKCAYDKSVRSNHGTERRFEWALDNSNEVLFWFKNGDKGAKALGIEYLKNGIPDITYPDYIVMLKDKSVALFEVKGLEGEDIDAYSTEKEIGLKQYLTNYGFKGGIVRIDTKMGNGNEKYFAESFDIKEYLK